MMRWKKLLLAAGGAFVLLVVALALLPFLFRDRIREQVRATINDAVDAQVDFGAIRVGLLRSFPNVSFSVDDLSVVGFGAFVGDTLVAVPRFRLVLDLRSVVRAYRGVDELLVRSISVDRPYVHARVLADGTNNWDILRDRPADPAPEAGSPTRFRIGLRELTVSGARLVLDDAQTSTHIALEGLDHTLAGDFMQDRFTLQTQTDVEQADFRQLGVPYLTGARLQVDAEVDADLVEDRFTLRQNQVRVNDVALALDGAFRLQEGLVELDVTFAAAEAAFNDVLSLVPAIYLHDFPAIQASGTVTLGGRVEGTYGPDDFPALALELQVSDGSFRYPDLPVPAAGIFVDLAVVNPGGDADSTTIRLDRFDITVGQDPFHARATLSTPLSDPEVDFALNGRIDLGAVRQVLKLEGVEELRGIVTTDAAAHTRLSWLQDEQYDRVSAEGGLEVTGLVLRAAALPHAVEVDELRLSLTPQQADLTALRARAGESDIEATGTLENLLGFALYGQDLRGRATVASEYVALDEWRAGRELEVIPVPARLDLTLSATVERMTLRDMQMTEARGTVRVQDERLTLDEFSVETLGGRMVMSGWYETVDPSRPTHDLEIAMRDIDVRSAVTTLNVVRAFAPVAAYATGRFSADLETAGPLGSDMSPVLALLTGRGSIRTADIFLEGMPILDAIADSLRIDRLRDPGFQDFAAGVEIREGRLHVMPFETRLGDMRMSVAGSNGLDQSLDYRLGMEIPRAWLGAEANRVAGDLISRAGRLGIDLGAAEGVSLDVLIGGTLTAPTLGLEVSGIVGSAGVALQDQVEQRLQEERERVEGQARASAAARADSIVAEAEVRAAALVAEAERLAETIRTDGNAQADRLEAEATTPLASLAARAAADRVRREVDERATQVVDEAERRAKQMADEARSLAEGIRGAP